MESKKQICLLLIIFSTTLFQCSESKLETVPIENSRSIRNVEQYEIPEVIDALKGHLGLSSNSTFTSSDQGQEINLEIDWTKIAEVVDPIGNQNYSFAIKDPENAPYTFHNLIVSRNKEGLFRNPLLITYKMSDEFKTQYDNTLSMEGFNGVIKRRFFNYQKSIGGSSVNSDLAMKASAGNGPCDDVIEVTESDGNSGTIGGVGSGPIGDTPPKQDEQMDLVCVAYLLESDGNAPCGPEESDADVCAYPPVLIIECFSVGGNVSPDSQDPCDETKLEIAIVNPNEQKPCPDDPVKDPKIAAQLGQSGVEGARVGNARKDKNGNPKTHNGLDVENNLNDGVYSMHSGLIYSKNYSEDFGNYVIIKSNIDGTTVFILYAHLKQYLNADGQVSQGQLIGIAGETGNLKDAKNPIDGSKPLAKQHLHIEAREGSTWASGTKVDVEKYLGTKYDSEGNKVPGTGVC